MTPNTGSDDASEVTEQSLDTLNALEPDDDGPDEALGDVIITDELVPLPAKIYLEDPRLRVRYGVGIVMLNKIQFGVTAKTVIDTFKTFGQVVYYMIRYVETCTGLGGIAGLIYKNKIDAVSSVKAISPFVDDGTITLVTTHSTAKEQEHAMKVMAVCACYEDYDFVPLNTLAPEQIDKAIGDFAKLMALIMD